jgi:hypothetical protein
MAGRSDDFEAREMHDGSRVLYRDKRVSRLMAALLISPALITTALAIFIPFVNATSDKPVPGAALPFLVAGLLAFSALFVGLGLVFSVMRTIISEKEVHVKYGLWGPRIPLEHVTSAKPVDYHWTEFGGWGIRLGKNNTWAYVPSGKRAVEIAYRQDGEDKRVLVGTENVEETARQINRAREQQLGGARFEVSAADVDRDVEAEEEAVVESERRRKTNG